MKIIFDSGSSSISAAVIAPGISPSFITIPQGHNAVTSRPGALAETLTAEGSLTGIANEVTEIDYYGAGCAGEEARSRVREELLTLFPRAKVKVESDMLCAAKALCGPDPGIACILGTGANSCLWDGGKITANVSPLGYVLGDEGSGAVMGRLFLGRMFKHQFPEDVLISFTEKYRLGAPDVIERVYRCERPNAFLASFAPFILEQAGRHSEVAEFVIAEFRRFLSFNVSNYPGCHELPIGFIGSVAWYFRPYLEEALGREGMKPGKFLREPLGELVKMDQSLSTVV